MISFKGAHFPKDIILYAVFFYVRYGVSYRDLEEIMAERGVKVDHIGIFATQPKNKPPALPLTSVGFLKKCDKT